MIATFYSFKGGVGRSMALANVASLLCERGLRTVMVDFDLEAPGLERFFTVDQKLVRGNPGLLDLLTTYKQCMAQPVGRDAGEFKNLDRFIVPVFRKLPTGGHLDLLPAGQRGDEDQLSNYAYLLRTFDWQEFYFEWAGEIFFRWLAKELDQRYDIVLVDSRTGVTEMGGVCAYQLADTLVMFCAANAQNVQGTRDVIQNFNSDRVRALRKQRPLEVIVTPSRVQLDSPELAHFHDEFAGFESFAPAGLRERGLSFWNLMIPYNPAFAFDERIVREDAAFRRVFECLALAVTLTAPAGSAVAGLADPLAAELSDHGPHTAEPVEAAVEPSPAPEPEFNVAIANDITALKPLKLKTRPEYDPTTAFAGYDVFLSAHGHDRETARRLAEMLVRRGQRVFTAPVDIPAGADWRHDTDRIVRASTAMLVLIGSEFSEWQRHELGLGYDRFKENPDFRVVVVLSPGAEPLPSSSLLADFQRIDMRSGVTDQAVDALVAALKGEPAKRRALETVEANPYPGLRTFEEADAPLFFGRRAIVERALAHLEQNHFLAIVGPSGSGKSGLIRAGIVPAIRERWSAGVLFAPRPIGSDIQSVEDRMRKSSDHSFLIVIDPLEELWFQQSLEDRTRFLDLLATGRNRDTLPYVVVALRADYYGHAAEHPRFAELLSHNQLLLSPMNDDELREAIERPARATGVTFEPGLVDRILRELGDSSNPLPLLQMLLNRLWQERRQGYITHESYARLGGVHVLSQTAEETYNQLSADQRAVCERVFLRLLSPARFRLTVPVDAFSAEERMIIDAFARASLLVVGTHVSLVHEALIAEWERLKYWVDANANRLRARDQLSALAQARPDLLTGATLTWAQEMVRRDAKLLGPQLVDFVKRSTRARRKRTLTTAAISVVVLAIAATIGGYYAHSRYERMLTWLGEAPVSFRPAADRALTVDPSGQARLLNATTGKTLAEFPDATAAALSPDGTKGAVGLAGGSVTIFDASQGKRQFEVNTGGKITSVAISPDNRRLACGWGTGKVGIWDIQTGRRITTGDATLGAVRSLSFRDFKDVAAVAAKGRFALDTLTGQVKTVQ